jgi:hypothetical protein
MAAIGKVSAVFTASTSGLTAGVKAASSSFRSLKGDTAGLASSMRALVAIQGAQLFGSIAAGAASAVGSLANLGKSALGSITSAVDQATSLGEELSKSSVIFGDAAAEIQKFAGSAEAIGLSRQAALQATGAFGNMFVAMGLGGEQAAKYATTMTALGADLASFNNTSVEDAVQAIGAALRGESEPIRRFGVLLDDATLKQAALDAGLVKSVSGALSPAIKAQAAYAAILQQTAKAQGDFARTSDSLANLSRVVSAQTTNIFATIGQAFQPLYQALAQATSSVLSAVAPLFEQVAGGMKASIQTITDAIQSLVPAFIQFVGTFDGANIGQAIGDGIIRGAVVLAGVADVAVAGLSSAFSYASNVGSDWSGTWSFISGVGTFLATVARLFQTGFLSVVRLLITPLSNIIEQVLNVASLIPGIGDTAAVMAAGVAGFRDGLDASIRSSALAARANIDALTSSGQETGSAIATPISNALGAAIQKANNAAASVDKGSGASNIGGPSSVSSAMQAAGKSVESGAKALERVAATPIRLPQAALDLVQGKWTPSTQAVRGIDARSSEGIAEFYRLVRGNRGDASERTAAASERTADATERMATSQPVVVEFA